jgi:hypothetical protein
MRVVVVLFVIVLMLPVIVDNDYVYHVFGTSTDDRIVNQNEFGKTNMSNGQDMVYRIVADSTSTNKTYKIGFVEPFFTYAAYNESSFYTFYLKYKDTKLGVNITTDLALLRNNSIPTGPFNVYNAAPGTPPYLPHFDYFSIIKEHVERIVPKAIFTTITDIDAHFGRIFDAENHTNTYDILFLFHNEYVTQEEYDNLKLFVANGGTIVFTEANALYAEIKYDAEKNSITLVKGHNWEFDGKVARKSVAERWPKETSEWTGSNFMFGKPTFVDIDFLNLPFNYSHSEEQHVTNRNANILHNYAVHDPKDVNFNATVATYGMNYGKGKVIGIGLYAHTLVGQEGFELFLKLFDYIVIPHSLVNRDYKLVGEREGEISVPSIMKTGEVSTIQVNNQLHVLTLNLKRSLLQQDNLTISIPRNLLDRTLDMAFEASSESYDIVADGKALDFDYIILDSETGFKISLPYDITTIQIHYTLPSFSINAPKDISLEAQGENNTLKQIGQPSILCHSRDSTLCGHLTISQNSPTTFPIGSTYVTWVAEDPISGLSVKDLQKITIYDDIPPDVRMTEPPINPSSINISGGIFNIGGVAYDKSGIEKVEAFAYELPFDGRFSYMSATPAVEDWSRWSMSLDVGNRTEIGVSVRATDKAGNRNWDKGTFSLSPEP